MKIAFIALRYDYGEQKRGPSLELKHFLPALREHADTSVFWLEDNGYPDNIDQLQENIKSFCTLSKPDVVFTVLMRDEIKPDTFDAIRAMGILCVNWFCDDQWRFDWSKGIAKHLNVAITVDKYSLDRYAAEGIKAIHGMWGADYTHSAPPQDYAYDVLFVGSKDPIREWYIQGLKEAGVKVTCFGSGWFYGRLPDKELKKSMQMAKINLCLSNTIPSDIRFHNWLVKNNIKLTGSKFIEQIKARNFEIPAAGGFQLAHFALEIEDYFRIGSEIACYANADDLVRQVKYYLINDTERESIKLHGWQRASKYTWSNQIKEVIDGIRHIMGRHNVLRPESYIRSEHASEQRQSSVLLQQLKKSI